MARDGVVLKIKRFVEVEPPPRPLPSKELRDIFLVVASWPGGAIDRPRVAI